MAEYTEHYAIAKHGPFGEGEALSAYSIVNPAMDTIDDILWEHKGLIDDLEARMDSAESRLTSLENRMSTAETNITNLQQRLENATEALWTAINNILSKINGNNTVNEETGAISWGIDGSIALGNINIYSSDAGYIRTTTNTQSTPGANDVRVQ